MNWDRLAELSQPLLVGAVTTLQLTIGAFAAALALGLALALLRLTRFRVVHWLLDVYVEIFRNTPVLAQLFIIYFGLVPLGIVMDAFLASVMGLGMSAAGYIAAVFRGEPP